MSKQPYVSIVDTVQAARLGRDTWLGRCFVFVDGRRLDAQDRAELARIRPGIDEESNGHFVLPLPRTGELELPGMRVASVAWPKLRLASLTSDKALYREGSDAVHVLAIDLLSPRAERSVVLRLNGREFLRQPLSLDEHGLAEIQWLDLPAGEYETRWSDSECGEPGCEFQVATYELAPLVASLVRSVLHDGRLSVLLQAESFGVPAEGSARLDLTDRGRRVDARFVKARGGRLYATLDLEGAGPHALQLQMVDVPSHTATVPLPGTRVQERAPTVFSKLGPVVTGSLLPGAGSRAVRGVYLQERGLEESPFYLKQVDGQVVTIEFRTATEAACVVVAGLGSMDTASADVVLFRSHFAAGETLAIDVPRPIGLLSVGAFMEGVPWEGAAVLLAPSPVTPRILLPNRATAGASLELQVDSPGLMSGSVYVVVKDARLPSADRPAMRLAGQIKRTAEDAAVEAAAAVNLRLADRYPTTWKTPRDGHLSWSLREWGPRRLAPEQSARCAEILVRRGVLSREQADEVQRIARETQDDLFDISAKLGYAEEADIVQALARELGLPYVDLATRTIPWSVVDLVPEAVARENLVLPIDQEMATLRVAVSNPFDLETLEKLRFILNRRVTPLLAGRASLLEAINRAYGEMVGEFADSMLMEFTDTAIDFTETAEYFAQTGPGEVSEDTANETQVLPAVQAEVLFAGLLPVRNGRSALSVDLPDTFTDYVAEAFAVDGLEWGETQARFSAVRDPYVYWHLPAHVYPGDTAVGRLQVGAASGRIRVRLMCDGRPVPLWCDGTPLAEDGELAQVRAELTFVATPGEYAVEVDDLETGACDGRTGRIDPPGKLRQIARTARVLEAGEAVSRIDAPVILNLQVLPNPRPVAQRLVDATANFAHLCCEQTAAKLFASAVAYFGANGAPRRRSRAAAAIRAGVRRQATMWLRGQGFKAYPDCPDEPSVFGRAATQHLLQMQLLSPDGADHLPAALREDWLLACSMAADTAEAYGIHWPELQPQSGEAAYGTVRLSDNHEAIQRALAQARLAVGWRREGDAVRRRIHAAYAAAIAGRLLRRRYRVGLAAGLALQPCGRRANQVFLPGLLRTAQVADSPGDDRRDVCPGPIPTAAAFCGVCAQYVRGRTRRKSRTSRSYGRTGGLAVTGGDKNWPCRRHVHRRHR